MLEQLRHANKAVGLKQVTKAVENCTVKLVFLARDADEKVLRSLKDICIKNSVEVVYMDTMKQLGKACGIEVGAATAAILK